MEYRLLKENEVEKEIEISVPRAELERLINEEAQRVQKELSIDGYRKGRVPQTLIKSRYADNLKAQGVDALVKQAYLKVLSENNWRPAGQAELRDLQEGEAIKFRLFVEVIPEFNVDNYLDIEIFREPALPDDYLLKQGMNSLREQYAVVQDAERPAVVDDLVTIDLQISAEGRSDQQNNQTVRIGDRSLPDELNRALVGMKKAEKKEVTVENRSYKIHLKDIKEKVLPLIDDEFALGLKFSGLEDLKQKLLENMKRQEEKRIEDELKESISEVLIQRTKFRIPNILINREYEKILKDYNLPDSDSNKERFWNVAEKRMRFNLILDRIAEKEKLMVSEDETMDLINKLGMRLTEHNRSDVMNYLGSILTREKTLNYLYEHAKISEKRRIVTPKEVANDSHPVRH
ncbi:MAG: trigger factor [candidate division WOR-3 bacterium]|nr:MAG: trigger factor [candidate division WOR-3 bacterium]